MSAMANTREVSVLADLQQAVRRLAAECSEIRSKLARLEVTAPPEVRKLGVDTIREAIKANPYAQFEVLADWKGQFTKGAVVRADHVPNILDLVSVGLLLGEPTDHSDVIERFRAEAEERSRAAMQEAFAARAAAARADAEAAASRAAASSAAAPAIDDQLAMGQE